MARRIAGRYQLARLKDMATATTRRPMLDDLIDRRAGQQLTTLALMTSLSTLLAPRRILAPPRRDVGRILTGRLRRVTRRALGLALQLRDPLLLTRDARRQLLDLRRQPLILRRQRQQHLDHSIATPLIDRLRVRPLHTTKFDKPQLCPPTN